MTKTMNLNLSEVQNKTAATALLSMAKYAEANLPELVDGPIAVLIAVQKIGMLHSMAAAFESNPAGVELMPNEAAALASALKFFILYTKAELGNIAEGDPKIILGGIQAIALSKALLDEVCEKGTALADEEEAEEQRKAA